MMTRSDYLGFRDEHISARLDLEGTLRHLGAYGYRDGYLEAARAAVVASQEPTFSFDALNSNYCDFCFTRIMGGEFERLSDGRERCVSCTRTVLHSGDEFEQVFREVLRNFEAAFDVSISVPITVRMVTAKEIARRTNETFEPTPGVDARVLGFAMQTREGYSLVIENGSPRLSAISTVAHELTHIWQYVSWDSTSIEQRYGAKNRLAVYEGMASWAQVQYLLYIRELDDAERQEAYTAQRTDEYGVGFRQFADRYTFARDGGVDIDTPFRHPFPL